MSPWGVQLVIGKLVTDEAFRQHFDADAREALATLCEQGIELSARDVAAFVETDPHVWACTAKRLDPHLMSPATAKMTRPRNGDQRRVLTERESQVLHGIFEGRTNKQIGVDIGVSESAVKATLQHLFRKTRVRTRAQLVRAVVEGSLASVANA
jgi:DNA-binding NarL/FixJ family response regulator